ncbi:MAG: TIGR03086 family protein [Hamadaea sp.]|uniref:TIGR03086 family metal-binding protein n=1 Tax=Hamadaea sp. TaxID=2024425 RepID=UPI0017B611B1|nr:TIGR03086 family metal-binding protein [Hamadaea sp.]NUT20836.1 TIGR03086 family protein [Hamadaea sp.]
MTQFDDHLAVLARALAQTGGVIDRVRPEQATLPTPCRSWNVRALVNHLVDEVHQFAFLADGGRRQHLGANVIGDDWTTAYEDAARALLTAWRQPGSSDRTHRLPGGELTADWTVGQHITEIVIHGWDIAKATGQQTDLDPRLARFALDWAAENVEPEFRGDEAAGFHIGIALAVADDAPLYDRLAAFSGRDPYAPGQPLEQETTS